MIKRKKCHYPLSHNVPLPIPRLTRSATVYCKHLNLAEPHVTAGAVNNSGWHLWHSHG